YLSPADLESAVINRYPDIAAAKLRTLLARRWGVTPEQVILGNGSNEVLLYTFLVFGGPDRTLLVFTPTYTMYARLGRLTGMRVHEEGVGVPYTLDARRVRDAVARVRPDVVCFSSPNNPTGGSLRCTRPRGSRTTSGLLRSWSRGASLGTTRRWASASAASRASADVSRTSCTGCRSSRPFRQRRTSSCSGTARSPQQRFTPRSWRAASWCAT